MSRSKELVPKIIPLSGKLIKSEDPLSIGENFQSLKNLRYTADHVKGIGGMTKINTTVPATYNKIRTAHHFKKDQPVESHVLAQAFDIGGTVSKIIDNKSVIPATGDFEAATVFTEATNSVTGHFSDAPSGNVAYCNGSKAAIWGGDEKRLARFINFDPGESFNLDYTEQLTNTLTDTSNTAALKNSSDISVWNTSTSGVNNDWAGIAWSPSLNLFASVAEAGGAGNRARTSPDGITWTSRVSAADEEWTEVAWSPSLNLFAAVGRTGTARVMTSPDGITWTIRASPVRGWHDIVWAGGTVNLFVAVAESGTNDAVMTSPDGVIWTSRTTPVRVSSDWAGIAWSPSLSLFAVVASADGGTVGSAQAMTSPDGIIWTERNISSLLVGWNGIDWSPALGLFAAVASGGAISVQTISTSPDGIIWTTRIAPTPSNWQDVVWCPEVSAFIGIASSQGRHIMSSLDGINWKFEQSFNGTWYGAAWSPSLKRLVVTNNNQNNSFTSMYSTADGTMYAYVGSLRTLAGFNVTIETANTIAGTMIAEYWNGSVWVAVSGLVDGTALTGKPIAQSGSVTFSSTDTVAKVKVIDSIVLYWYRIRIASGVSATTSISYVTLDSPFQAVKDIWDGILREELSFQVSKVGILQDNTINVFKDTYDSVNTVTFSDISSIPAYSDFLLAGFSEQMQGIEFHFVSGSTNATNDTIVTVSYWNGSDWIALSVVDGTGKTTSTRSFRRSGVISWDAPAITSEFKREINKGVSLYQYKIHFDQALSATVKLFFVAGIPAQKTIKGFSFPMLADNRLWLLDEVSDERNACIVTAQSAPDVYNGTDTERFKFGGEEKLTAGAWIYQNIGAEVRSIKIITKQNETWIIEGTTPQNWIKYQLSDKIGCVAPATMKTFTLGDDQSQQVAIFQGSRGIYLCDGRSIVPIHNDIRQLFDDRQGASINLSRAKDSVGVFDEEKREYHWFFADGSNTALNRELVYDVLRKRWFEIDRGTGNRLQYALNVSDTDGNNFLYGTIDLGFLLRLENGNNFIGVDIAHEFQLGDMVFVDLMHLTQIEKIKLIGVAKQISTPGIGVTHFGDSNTTGSILSSLSVDHAGHRLFGTILSHRLGDYYAHSLKFTQSTGLESIGFEPIAIGIYYKDINEHLLNIDSQPLTGGLFGTGNFGE